MGVLCGGRPGITRLSELIIDADKNWQAKGIHNIKHVASGMAIGHIVQHNGAVLEAYAPGSPNLVLTSMGPGNKVLWAPGGTYYDRFFPVLISLSKSQGIFTPDKSKSLSAPMDVEPGHDLTGGPLHPAWFRRQMPSITSSKALIAPYTAPKTASKSPAVDTVVVAEIVVAGAIADDGGVQTDETAAAKSVPAVNQQYNTSDDNQKSTGGATWEAQTFTMTTTHRVRYVRLKLYRSATPGNITISIRATDGSGHPTGGDLCSAAINGNELTATSPGYWYRIDFGSPVTLNTGTKYAIVIRSEATGLYWRSDNTSPTYAGGNREYSSNGGTSWSTDNTADFMFEEYGSVNDMTLFPAAVAAGDAYYFGSLCQFPVLIVDTGQAGGGTYTVVWEYSKAAGAYGACVGLSDGSNAFKNQWTREVSHTPQGDWVTQNLLGYNLYWLRARCNNAGAGYTQPLGTFAKVKIYA